MSGLGIGCCCGFVLLLILEEVGLRFVAARRSGWHRLARRYPAPANQPSRAIECRVRLGDQWSRSPVTLTVTGAGLGLSVRPLLGRPFHPPVSIPWDDLTVVWDDWADGTLPLRAGDAAFVRLTGPAVPLVLTRLRVDGPARRHG